METQPAYWAEPLTWEFEARVTQKTSLGNGRFEVILDKSYFYPTGGGQPHDTGTLDGAAVIDVFRAKDGAVVHLLEGDIAGPRVAARIDGARRLGHMQHHSAQHILSAALETLLDLETLSVKISAASPSTLDVPDVELSEADWDRVERLANQLVFENRPIKTYFVTADQLATVPLRRPPQVTGPIRVVEVTAFDYSACGGTHCPSTGMIGLVKIVKTERKNQKLRLHFVAGQQALTCFQQAHDLVTGLCHQLNIRPEEVVNLVNRQVAELVAAQREIKRLRTDLLSFEARELSAQTELFGAVHLVTKLYPNWSINELRELAGVLPAQDNLVAVLAGYDGQKLSLVVRCDEGSGLSARELLARCLVSIEGKGSGDARLAQGGGTATLEEATQLLAQARTFLES